MRVVQDSEDEDELDLDDVAPAAPDGRDASLQHADLSPQAGTGSTGEPSSPVSGRSPQLTESTPDSLKRTIEAAHRAHLQSPSSASSDHSRHHSSDLALEHDSKRRKTSTDRIAMKSPMMSSSTSRKAPVTYGKSKTNFDSPTLEQRLDGSESRQTVATEPLWNLQGTVREAWQQHEPTGLFPEPSSTVPNATATQRQLLDQVLASDIIGVEAESNAAHYEPAKSSVPWSEYLKSSARNTQDQPDPSDQSGPPSDQHQSSQLQNGSGKSSLEPTPPLVPTSQPSQKSRQSSIPHKGSPLGKEVLQDPVEPKQSMGPPLTNNHTNDVGIGHNDSPAIPNDELGMSPNGKANTADEVIVVSPSIKAKRKSSLVPNSEDDLMAIGIPKEKYKPRPSRSRSLKLSAEAPIDYSVRPEKAARKSRRSRTTGGENSSSASTPEKIQQICEMGFTPTTTQRALRQNNGDIASTVDWLVANGMAEDELAPARLPKTTRKKASNKDEMSLKIDAPSGDASTSDERKQESSLDTTTRADAIPSINVEGSTTKAGEKKTTIVPAKSPKVSVVIPRSKGQNTSPKIDLVDNIAVASPKHELVESTSKQVKRRKTTMDPPEIPVESTSAIADETPKGKRRGRGRPRKESQSTETVSEVQHDNAPADTGTGTSTVLQEIDTNACIADTTEDADGARETTPTPSYSHPGPPPTTPPKDTTGPSSKPPSPALEKSSKIAAAGKNMTLGKGKTPYRVGLSKRQRIAPLLRIVKK